MGDVCGFLLQQGGDGLQLIGDILDPGVEVLLDVFALLDISFFGLNLTLKKKKIDYFSDLAHKVVFDKTTAHMQH